MSLYVLIPHSSSPSSSIHSAVVTKTIIIVVCVAQFPTIPLFTDTDNYSVWKREKRKPSGWGKNGFDSAIIFFLPLFIDANSRRVTSRRVTSRHVIARARARFTDKLSFQCLNSRLVCFYPSSSSSPHPPVRLGAGSCCAL
uniref:Uncharacterized protein n=1 Tax=Caenorhabditis japonica TaxID=281687 RepID=A0A8R1IM71_CAEJA